ncbi:hypothetical protein [Flammeovirga sp. EKP202]|uniref:hypothetical protein n=1 Tax=Flammeovirga sp. EKP202 TaxID=2770592 RepID=UPI00165F2214|nr:hypothetical protein [Flammeovirga sp. EKP202]MBD0403652.1 hypothetical protein [Flammeovirga sp. EKP202]
MKKLFLVLSFSILFSYLFAEEKSSFKAPENEYLINKMIDELEDESKEYKKQMKECDRLRNTFSTIESELKALIQSSNDSSSLFNSLKSKGFVRLSRSDYEEFENYDLKSIGRDVSRSMFKLDILLERVFYPEDYPSQNFDFSKIKGDLNEVTRSVGNGMMQINKLKSNLELLVSDNHSKLEALYTNKGQSSDLHKVAIWLGLPAFCITILILFLFPYYLERKTETTDPNANNKQYLLDVATVLLLTMTILILGLAKMITGEVLGTLLGGISGYVLNRNMKK